jgi:hypothetical protein
MGDAGEGLVDAEDRIQQRLAEREQEKDKARQKQQGAPRDPAREREARSLTLARTELARQAEATQNPARQEQLRQALAEIDRRIAAL